MPHRHGLDVSIITPSRETFTEYGVNTHARSKLVTAKIEARNGIQFFILIRPDNPFPSDQKKRPVSSFLTRAQTNALHYPKTPITPRYGMRSALENVENDDETAASESKEANHGDRSSRTLYISKLQEDATEEMLRREFRQFGKMTGVLVPLEYPTLRSKG
jgi:RNA recognition motif. (a.k.a. RRM, RBD, or RNP domain)